MGARVCSAASAPITVAPGFISRTLVVAVLGLDQRPLDLQDDIGPGEGPGLVRRDGGAGFRIGLVGEPRPGAGARFDDNLEPEPREFSDRIGGCGDPPLVAPPFPGYRKLHDNVAPGYGVARV